MKRSSASRATRTLSRCASRIRWSPPSSAVNETDFGAENVASQPARCFIAVMVFPFSSLYSCASRCRTSCSPLSGCSPWLSLANASSLTTPFRPGEIENDTFDYLRQVLPSAANTEKIVKDRCWFPVYAVLSGKIEKSTDNVLLCRSIFSATVKFHESLSRQDRTGHHRRRIPFRQLPHPFLTHWHRIRVRSSLSRALGSRMNCFNA